jgi:glutathione peroxidase
MLTDRRRILALFAGAFATPGVVIPSLAQTLPPTQAPAMSRITAYAFSFAGLEAGDIKLADHAGKPILVVNTAVKELPRSE